MERLTFGNAARVDLLRGVPARYSRSLIGAVWIATALWLASNVFAAGGEPSSFISLSDRLTLAALLKGHGQVSEEAIRANAEVLFKYLEGDPKPKERTVVRSETQLQQTGVKQDEISIYVGYDNGHISRGYLFRFKKNEGRLIGANVVLD